MRNPSGLVNLQRMLGESSANSASTHSIEMRQVYERILGAGSIRGRLVDVGAGTRVHVLEKGAGDPLVLIHGTSTTAGFFVPLLNELNGIRAIAPDRPGQGLSDPIEIPRHRYHDAAGAWLDRVLNTLDLGAITLLGHSAGGVLALRYALAHPHRIKRLVLIAPPTLPHTRCPLPYRLIGTPGLGDLLPRLLPPSPKSTLQFVSFMGEKTTIVNHPHMLDLLVAAARDPLAATTARREARVLVTPFALLSPSGFRRGSRVRPDELRRIAMPTLLIWGEREPLGDASVAQGVIDLIPNARLVMLPAGHAPWLGYPAETGAAITDFMRGAGAN
jgi:pimeloyl-ACP methyl ester carboxylesterase